MLFLSTYKNKIDKKGRVSVPSSFRNALLKDEYPGVIAYESINNKCIEACSLSRIEQLNNTIDSLDPYSDERDAFATIILGGSVQLSFDSEGRILLPEKLIDFAGLSQHACFVGKGRTFEIWDPDNYDDYYSKAKEMAVKNKGALRFYRGGENK